MTETDEHTRISTPDIEIELAEARRKADYDEQISAESERRHKERFTRRARAKREKPRQSQAA